MNVVRGIYYFETLIGLESGIHLLNDRFDQFLWQPLKTIFHNQFVETAAKRFEHQTRVHSIHAANGKMI